MDTPCHQTYPQTWITRIEVDQGSPPLHCLDMLREGMGYGGYQLQNPSKCCQTSSYRPWKRGLLARQWISGRWHPFQMGCRYAVALVEGGAWYRRALLPARSTRHHWNGELLLVQIYRRRGPMDRRQLRLWVGGEAGMDLRLGEAALRQLSQEAHLQALPSDAIQAEVRGIKAVITESYRQMQLTERNTAFQKGDQRVKVP